MGQARETMDRVTAAVMSGDRDALGQLYAADAVAETPEGPRLAGSSAGCPSSGSPRPTYATPRAVVPMGRR